jgi:hypothetical protein
VHHHYYDNLSEKILEERPRLIVMIEAALYCESYEVKSIRYSQLKIRSNEMLNKITRGRKSDLGGNFGSIIKTLSDPLIPKKDRHLTRRHIKIKGKREETHFYPNFPVIQREVKRSQAENIESGKWRLVSISKDDRVHRGRSLRVESVPISEMLGMSVTHASK